MDSISMELVHELSRVVIERDRLRRLCIWSRKMLGALPDAAFAYVDCGGNALDSEPLNLWGGWPTKAAIMAAFKAHSPVLDVCDTAASERKGHVPFEFFDGDEDAVCDDLSRTEKGDDGQDCYNS